MTKQVQIPKLALVFTFVINRKVVFFNRHYFYIDPYRKLKTTSH